MKGGFANARLVRSAFMRLIDLLKRTPFGSLTGIVVLSLVVSTERPQAAEPGASQTFTVHQGTNFAAAISPDGARIVIDMQGDLRILPARGGKAVPLATLSGEARLPSWSPDGKLIAFQYYIGEQWHIYTLRADGTGLHQVTYGACDDREPTWLPDGRTIVFSSDRSGNFDIWQVAIDGSGLVRLTTGPGEKYYPSVSPNGAGIAFVAGDADPVSRQVTNPTLKIRSSDGAVRTILTANDNIALPSWSPDGRFLAYMSYLSNGLPEHSVSTGLHVAAVADGSVTQVSKDGEDVFISRPQWLRDGGLLYTADGEIKRSHRAGAPDVISFSAEFTVAPAKPYVRKVHDFTSREPRQAKGILHPVVSPDGMHIAFTALGDLWLLNMGDPHPLRLTNDPFVKLQPAWSPDGRTLAYVSDRRGTGIMDLYVRDMKSGAERRLTETVESLEGPVFSPDGTKIAVTMLSSDNWHANYPYVFNLKTGELKRVYDWLFNPSIASWSRDGKTLNYVALLPSSHRFRYGLNEIIQVPLDGSAARFVTPTPGKSLGIRAKDGAIISPDGHHMAFVEDGTLWTVAINDNGTFISTPRRMTNDLADEPSWIGDSKSIVYLSGYQLKRIFLDDAHIEDIPLELQWQPAIPRGRKVVHVGRLFDGRNLAYRDNVDVVIDDNVVTAVVPHKDNWPGAELIDASNKVVIPGMFENHIHDFAINGEPVGRIALGFGITSIREPGCDPSEGVEEREAWASGRRTGPRLFTTGLIEGARIFYPMSLPVTSAVGLELEMERARLLDLDFIKTYERLDSPFQKRVIEEAHQIGIPVTSHDLYPSAMFGIDAVEHLNTQDRIVAGDRLSLTGKLYEDVEQILLHGGLFDVPTVVGADTNVGAYYLQLDGRAFKDLKQLKLLPARVLTSRYWKRAMSGDPQSIMPALLKLSADPLTRIHHDGIITPPGTDASYTNLGFGIVTELRFYVDAGFSPAEALRAATLESARLNQVEDKLGSIEPGKLADLVVVEGDPLKDILDVLNVDTVIKDGRVFTFSQLAAGAQPGQH